MAHRNRWFTPIKNGDIQISTSKNPVHTDMHHHRRLLPILYKLWGHSITPVCSQVWRRIVRRICSQQLWKGIPFAARAAEIEGARCPGKQPLAKKSSFQKVAWEHLGKNINKQQWFPCQPVYTCLQSMWIIHHCVSWIAIDSHLSSLIIINSSIYSIQYGLTLLLPLLFLSSLLLLLLILASCLLLFAGISSISIYNISI
jgi:hypothetical protein